MITFRIRVANVGERDKVPGEVIRAIRDEFKDYGYETNVVVGMICGIPITTHSKDHAIKVGQILESHGIEIIVSKVQEVTMKLSALLQ